MEKIAIVVDSSSGIKEGEFKDVYVLPLSIIETTEGKNKVYADGIDISNDDLCDKIKNGANISTSQASVGEIMKIIDQIEDKYDRIYALPIPGTLSGSINAWQIVAKECSKLYVIKQYMVSILTRWTVQHLIDLKVKNELTDEKVENYMNKIANKRAAAVLVPDIKQLVKGGRISNFKSFIIEKLNLKLVLSLDQKGLKLCGKSSKIEDCLDVIDKFFKKEKGFKNEQCNHATILWCNNPDKSFDIDNLVKIAKARWPNVKFETGSLPAVIVAHTGVNYICIGFDCK